MSTHVERPGARWWVPERLSPANLRAEVHACQGCELHLGVSRGVMGTGNPEAELLVLGEQPSEQDDRLGAPFAGAAGKLLDRALEDVGIDPTSVYRTHVVKHFRHVSGRAGQRLHRSPSQVHVAACRPWLLAELELVRPTGVIVLGGAAGKALYGPGFRVGQHRGRMHPWPEPLGGVATGRAQDVPLPDWVLTTTHPGAVLRARGEEEYEEFVDDLRAAAKALAG